MATDTDIMLKADIALAEALRSPDLYALQLEREQAAYPRGLPRPELISS